MARDARIDPARLRFRCRRGMRELDLMLVPFAERALDGLDARERGAFAELLEAEDAVLLGWLLGREEPEDRDVAAIVERIRHAAGS